MIKGVLIAESLVAGAKIEAIPLTLTGIYRVAVTDATDYQPPVWTIMYFDAEDANADTLAERFADQLDAPGWYVDMHNDTTVYVVFPGKVFRYAIGDPAGRAEAVAYATGVAGVPDTQLWGEGNTPDPALT
ncbi:hypothetical protein [Nocardia neocaledoniensis]|uniref:hypothetical protein n=1 Tax=Nocardia neocaledoniensis TaxID=236511 RepID=UPI002458686C|nr:hypothetical protein [Nocardia neocaledoniensis]